MVRKGGINGWKQEARSKQLQLSVTKVKISISESARLVERLKPKILNIGAMGTINVPKRRLRLRRTIMTIEQKLHVNYLQKEFSDRMAEKYEAGQKEHGGNLWDLQASDLLDNAIEEAIDQVVYLLTLKNAL